MTTPKTAEECVVWKITPAKERAARIRTSLVGGGRSSTQKRVDAAARAIAKAQDEAIEATLELCAETLDDLRWVEHNKGCDERLGDGSPGAIAKCAHDIRALTPADVRRGHEGKGLLSDPPRAAARPACTKTVCMGTGICNCP